MFNPEIADSILAERPPDTRRAYVVNARDRSEMITSVQMGLAGVARCSLRQRVDAVLADGTTLPADAGYLICPGDRPGVTAAAIDRCVAAFVEEPERIVIATSGGKRGHPIILPTDIAGLVLSWSEDQRLDTMRTRYPGRVCEVETDEPGVLIDVNRPEDIERFNRRS